MSEGRTDAQFVETVPVSMWYKTTEIGSRGGREQVRRAERIECFSCVVGHTSHGRKRKKMKCEVYDQLRVEQALLLSFARLPSPLLLENDRAISLNAFGKTINVQLAEGPRSEFHQLQVLDPGNLNSVESEECIGIVTYIEEHFDDVARLQDASQRSLVSASGSEGLFAQSGHTNEMYCLLRLRLYSKQ